MGLRSQRHLREEVGIDSNGDTYEPGKGPQPPIFGADIPDMSDSNGTTISRGFGKYFRTGTGSGAVYSMSNPPTGLSMNPANGLVTGVITGSEAAVQVTLTTSEGSDTSNVFQWDAV